MEVVFQRDLLRYAVVASGNITAPAAHGREDAVYHPVDGVLPLGQHTLIHAAQQKQIGIFLAGTHHIAARGYLEGTHIAKAQLAIQRDDRITETVGIHLEVQPPVGIPLAGAGVIQQLLVIGEEEFPNHGRGDQRPMIIANILGNEDLIQGSCV